MDLGREALEEDVCNIGSSFLCEGMRGAGGGTFVLVIACGEIGDIQHRWGEGRKGCGVGLLVRKA